MRLVFLTHYYPPEGNAPATRVGALARRWVEAGHHVTVITGVPNVPNGVVYPGYRNRLWPQKSKIEGVHVIRVGTFIAPNKGSARRILNYLSFMISAFVSLLFVRRPDILIATSPQFFCGWAGVLGKWWFRCSRPWSRTPKFVLEIRDIWPESIGAVDAIGNKRVLSILEWLELRMYAAANHIVTVGQGYRERLLERGVPEKKISIAMNGVDRDLLETSEPDPSALRRELGLEGKFICSYIGTIGMASGLDVFLRAARLLRDQGEDRIRLLAVGDGAVREELEERAAIENLNSVIFTGRRPKEDMPVFLAATDVCFVHLRKTPLFQTVMPSKIFEAFGMRRPILIGVEGEARKLVDASGGGWAMPPEDEKSLVSALLKALDDRNDCEIKGERGRNYVVTHFDRDQLAKDYLDILRAVALDEPMPRYSSPY